MTVNARLQNLPSFLELVRFSNHALNETIEANYQKNRTKLFQRSELAHVV